MKKCFNFHPQHRVTKTGCVVRLELDPLYCIPVLMIAFFLRTWIYHFHNFYFSSFYAKLKVCHRTDFAFLFETLKLKLNVLFRLGKKNKEVALGESLRRPGISSINNAIIYNRILVIKNILSIICKITAPGNWLLIRNMRTVKFLHLWNQCEWAKSLREKEI